MKLIKCKICGKEHQGRVCSSFARSTAALKETQEQARRRLEPRETPRGQIQIAGTQALPVDTTPKPKFNKTTYMKTYMADLRAAKKIGITIREYRERKRDEPTI